MDESQQLFTESRGVSTTVGYTALLSVTVILLGVIMTGGHSIVAGQTNIVATEQLETSGVTLTDEITTVHRMATKSTETNTEITSVVELPERTVEGQYLIQATNQNVVLETTTSDIKVISPLPESVGAIDITTADGRIDGGDVEIAYSGSGDIIVSEE